MSAQVESFLAHFGVKGMKWGVRRALGINKLSGSNDDAYHPKDKFHDRAAKGIALDVVRSGLKDSGMPKGVRKDLVNAAKADLAKKPWSEIQNEMNAGRQPVSPNPVPRQSKAAKAVDNFDKDFNGDTPFEKLSSTVLAIVSPDDYLTYGAIGVMGGGVNRRVEASQTRKAKTKGVT